MSLLFNQTCLNERPASQLYIYIYIYIIHGKYSATLGHGVLAKQQSSSS